MRVTILGSGTAVPVTDRLPAGVLVQAGGAAIAVDLGPGTLRQLPKLGLDLNDLTGVLLTHYHTDHTADLAALLFALRNPRFAGRPPLWIGGAPGLRALLQQLTGAWPWLAARGYRLAPLELTPGPHALPPFSVDAVSVEHTAESLAYRIEAGGARCAISGDSDVCDGLVEVARGVDLFVCEAAFPDGHKVDGHLTPALAAAAAERAGARRLCLTHFYPECEGHDLAAAAAAEFSGEVVLATDLCSFELGGT